MSHSPPTAPLDALARLRDRFRASSGKTVAVFRGLADQLAQKADSAEVLDALRKELHRVRGTAGTYGFSDASELAGVLEPRAIRWMEHAGLELERRAELVRNFASALELAFGVVPDGDDARSALRVMLLVGVPEEIATPLRAEGPLQGYTLWEKTFDEFCATDLGAEPPDVVVTSASLLRDVRTRAMAASVPVIALDEPLAPYAVRATHTPYDGVVVVEASHDAAMLFEVAGHSTRQTTTAGATMLVVDDDPSILTMVRALMDPDGLRVVTLNDPGRLVETLEQVMPALLLMDVSMRDFDGIALTRGLRADVRWRTLPIVLFSSEADAGQRRLAYAALADDFVAKPIVPDELRRRLRHQLDRVRLTRLGEGQHPGTGLSLPVRTLREATRMLEGASALDAPRALALIRPTTMPTDGASSDAWMQECGRIAQAIALRDTTLVGMCDETGLIAITQASADALRVALVDAAGRRGPKGVAWTAGVADTTQRAATFDALCTAASEARELVTDEVVRCWTPDDERVAPDVVVVEDDQALSDMVQYALRSAGFTFRAYANGTQAQEALLALRPGPRRVLVLLDVDLPGMDGHSLHERLRIMRPGQFAVVFTTARASEAEQLRALRGGAIDYVTKPIALRVLVAKVKVWLELAGVRPS